MPVDTAAVPEPLLDEVYEDAEVLGDDHDQHQETDQYNLDKHADHKGKSHLSEYCQGQSHSEVQCQCKVNGCLEKCTACTVRTLNFYCPLHKDYKLSFNIKVFWYLVKSFYKVNTVQYKEGADEYFSADTHYTPFGKSQYPSQKQSQIENPENKVHDVKGYFSENNAFRGSDLNKFKPEENYFDLQNFKTDSKSYRHSRHEEVRRKPENTKYFQNIGFHNSNIPSFKETDLRNPSFDIASFRPTSFATF